MRTTLKMINKRRVYSEDFKRGIVKSFETGKYSISQLQRLYTLPAVSIYRWIYKFSTFNEPGVRVVEMKASHLDKLKELEQKVKDLERSVGQKQIMIDYLEKMMDIAKSDLNIDIKKSYGTPRSTGSGKTKAK